MQGKKLRGSAESVFQLVRILLHSFWTLPSSLSPVWCSWNNPGNKQAPLGPRQVTMGIVLTSSPTASQLLPSTCALTPQEGTAQLHRFTPRTSCHIFSHCVPDKTVGCVTCTEIDTNSPGQADSLNLMAVGWGCHSDMQPLEH